MTVHEYMVRLPKELFAATLLGIMDAPLGGKEQESMMEWLNSPYQDSFPEIADLNIETMKDTPVDKLHTLFGRAVFRLPDDAQEQLRRKAAGCCELAASEGGDAP